MRKKLCSAAVCCLVLFLTACGLASQASVAALAERDVQALEALANPQDNIYYLNVNEAVMDANGCLDASLTSDGIHLLGNSLSLWEDYLKQHAIVPGGTGTAATTLTTYTTAVTNTPAAQ